MSDDRDFYDDSDFDLDEREEPMDCAAHEPAELYFFGLLPGETADANGRPILPPLELIAGIHKKKETTHD